MNPALVVACLAAAWAGVAGAAEPAGPRPAVEFVRVHVPSGRL